MKVLAILALVQIAGTALAQEQKENLNFRLLHQFRAELNRLDAIEYESPFFSVNELAQIKCERNGGPNARDTVTEGVHTYADSVRAQKNATLLQLEAMINQPNNGLNSAVEPICQFITNMTNVIKTFTKSLGVCWTQPERNSIDLIHNVTTAVTQFMCEDGGSRFSAFLGSDDLPCLYSKFENGGIERCAHVNFVGNVSPIDESSDRTVSLPWSVPVIVPKTENCIEFKYFQRCVVAAVQGCATSRLLEEMNALFIIFYESTGCKSLLGTFTLPAINTN